MNRDSMFDCIDCGTNTSYRDGIAEYYMVDWDLWETYVPEENGMLCIGCLEIRIGRQLTPTDFLNVPINSGFYPMSDRLADRLGLVI